MGFSYQLVKILFKTFIQTFFKNIEIIGLENIPIEGPTIICGNHSNQFVDGMMIVASILREVGFIMAAKSVRRPIIGHLAKSMNVIPVERAQDLAFNGKGKIVMIKNNFIKGENSIFQKEINVGDSIFITFLKKEFIIKEIISDTLLKIIDNNDDLEIESNYKIIPKIDQSSLFESVYTFLKEGKVLGIFPEGGSHDRTELLELKAGISIMALGAISKYGLNIKIVPIGLNYYKSSEFRSKVIINIGKSFEVPKEISELYKQNKKEAVGILLTEIEKRLKSCLIPASSYSELSSIFIIRDIYKPEKVNLTPEKEMILNQKFALALLKLKKEPSIELLFLQIKNYMNKLKNLNIKDEEALPGLLMTGPMAILLHYLGEKERIKALNASKVKIEARDVIASYKMVCALVLFPINSIIFTSIFRFIITKYFKNKNNINLKSILFFILCPIYVFVMVRSVDGVRSHYRSIKAKFMALIFESRYRNLQMLRNDIQKKVRELVDFYGPKLYEDFEKSRIIPKDEIAKSKKKKKIDEIFELLEEKGI